MTKREKEELTNVIDEIYGAFGSGADDIELFDRLFRTVRKMVGYKPKIKARIIS